MLHKERLLKPELCGGALLDVGVYAINFFRMFCDARVERVISNCMKSDLGVDLQNAASYVLDNGVMANIQSSALCVNDNQGVISGTKACLAVDRKIGHERTLLIGIRSLLYLSSVLDKT